MKTLFAILLSCLFLLASPLAAMADTVHAYDAGDNGKSFDIGPDSLLTVSLEANPSTGYRWVNVPVNPFKGARLGPVRAVFPVLDETFVPANPGLPGTNGIDIFSYKVESMGAGGLKLEKRSPGGETVKTVEISFMVVNP